MRADFTPEQLKLLDDVENLLPKELQGILDSREGARIFVRWLPELFAPESVLVLSEERVAWEQVGNFYRNVGRFYEAIAVYDALYNQMLIAQEKTGIHCSKGMPVVWMSDCYLNLGCPLVSLRFLMLALIEDAIFTDGDVPEHMGVYFRAVWRAGLPDADLRRYAQEAYAWFKANGEEAFYPERVLIELDQNWVRPPDSKEIGIFPSNPHYIRHLIGRLGDGSGKTL